MDKKPINKIIEELDIWKGDVVLVSSDLVRLWSEYRKHHNDFSAQKIIECIQHKIGVEGTLLFPTYSWDFCHGLGFDYRLTSPSTGGLGRTALEMGGFRRTSHPIYSFAVWGKDRELLCAMDNKSAFGKDSPFEYLKSVGAKNLTVGVIFNHCFTFAHYVEECASVPYRYLKQFTGEYIDNEGEKSIRTYLMLVRNLDLNVINTPKIDAFMDEKLVRQSATHYGVEFKIVYFAEAFDLIYDDIIHNRARNIAAYVGQED